MLAYDAETKIGLGLNAFCEPPAPSSLASPSSWRGDNRGGLGLVALADTPLASRFCSWAGLSGRRYIFSVYPWSECPAFCHAVLIAAVSDKFGRRRSVSIFDTGVFPEPVLMQAKRDLGSHNGRLEIHMHLLAPSAAQREAILKDLAVHSI
jgi:hypothetical protein